MSKSTDKRLAISMLDSLPEPKPGQKRTNWTTEMDALLLAGWRRKRQKDVARLLGLNIGTCRTRYEELTRE
jgi:hypothetical protein